MPEIQKTAVLGAGTMGSAIAAHMANAGAEVVLLDIVPEDAGNRRNIRAEEALEKMEKQGRAFTNPQNVSRIEPGNFEDDMEKLEDCAWIVEAVVENPEIKNDLFQKVDQHRQENSIVSSNTSTIPLENLKEKQSTALKGDLIITHFFNPPRQMRLLELVSGRPVQKDGHFQDVIDFIDKKLGKTVIEVKDTPGFIGNRLGLFWMLTGLQQALEQNIPVPMADEIMGKKLGFPKTGIFGLFDLVGVDLMKELGKSLQAQLPKKDGYHKLDKAINFLEDMEQSRFYKKEEGQLLPLNLQEMQYEDPPPYKVEDNLTLASILEKRTDDAEYARTVMLRVLNYACACLPDIANTVDDADTVMRLGFNWKQGPFQMIDSLGDEKVSGAAVLIDALEDNDLIPAAFLQRARTGPFYKEQKGKLYYLAPKDGFVPRTVQKDKWTLADIARETEPVLENKKARLWDLGDGIACLQLRSKMDTFTTQTFDLMAEAVDKVESDFAGMIIGDDDQHFSAGLDLNMLLEMCEKEDWDQISNVIRTGQKIMMRLKYAPFPVIGAPSGKALGGACEMLLHSDGIQASMESYIGLVEVKIGVVPAWGGCKEMLLRHLKKAPDNDSKKSACATVFDIISQAKTSSSAEEFPEMIAGHESYRITMNRERLLPEAKEHCLSLLSNYKPPEMQSVDIPADVHSMLEYEISGKSGHLDAYDKRVLQNLAEVLSGGDHPGIVDEQQILDLEHAAFIALIQNKETQDKIRDIL